MIDPTKSWWETLSAKYAVHYTGDITARGVVVNAMRAPTCAPSIRNASPQLHPQVFDAQISDGAHVVEKQLLGPREKPLLYAKHMAKQKLGIDNSLFKSDRARHMV